VSTLAVTDPDLIEIFDNFAFDEVMSDLAHGAACGHHRLPGAARIWRRARCDAALKVIDEAASQQQVITG
jgi:hypothetical protein